MQDHLHIIILLRLDDWFEPKLLVTKQLKASLTHWTNSPQPSFSQSHSTITTFRIRPPIATISTLTGLSCSEFSVWIMSARRSDRSSQHIEAFIIILPSFRLLFNEITVISSVSVGMLSLCSICEVICFSSFNLWTTFASRDALSVYDHFSNKNIIINNWRNPNFIKLKNFPKVTWTLEEWEFRSLKTLKILF